MTYPLAGVKAKLAYGTTGLNLLELFVNALVGSDAYSFVTNFDPEQNCQVITVRVRAEPTNMFGLLAGDIVQQFRSSLDHLAYQLALLNRPAAKGVNFPIYTDEQVYLRPVGVKNRSPRDVCRRAFRPADLALIEAAQPYTEKSPRDSELARLQRFSNLDKHKILPASVGIAETIELFAPPADFKTWIELRGLTNPAPPLRDGTVVGRYLVWPEKAHRMEVPLNTRFGVGFGADFLTIGELHQIAIRVIGVVNEFESAIPELRS